MNNMVEREKLCFSVSSLTALVGAVLSWACLVGKEVFYRYCRLLQTTSGVGGLDPNTCVLDTTLAVWISVLMVVFGVFYASRTYVKMGR